MRFRSLSLLAGVAVLATGHAQAEAMQAGEVEATITLTAHGIPHVVANDFRGLGYGYGYAMARNDLCAMADAFATLSGRRSMTYGVEGETLNRHLGRVPYPNVVNDLSTRLIANDPRVARAKAALSPDLLDLVQGYAAGYNRYLADTPQTERPRACRDLVLTPVGEDDIVRRMIGQATLVVSRFLLPQMYAAAPPMSEERLAVPTEPALSEPAAVTPGSGIGAGSNALAVGGTLTSNGAGLLLGNPHYLWDGPDRFIQAHLTIPGRYDVMGVGMAGAPLISIGFNRSLAWTYTVSTDVRGSLYRLKLDPADATRYLVDGVSEPMTRQAITVPTTDAAGDVAHTFWMTRYGPVVEGPALPWDSEVAYAVADANAENFRILDLSLVAGQSDTVQALKEASARVMGAPYVNMIAADAAGGVLYADMSVAIGVEAGQAADCAVTSSASAYSFFVNVMDGSRSSCGWRTFADTPQDGILPASKKPWLIRNDFIANSNDSYWLVNPAHPLRGYSPVVGPVDAPQRARTRLGVQQVRDRLGSADGLPGNRFDLAAVEAILFSNRNGMAELVADDLVSLCEANPVVTLTDGSAQDLGRACAILKGWDRRDDLDSRGVLLFRQFLANAAFAGPEAGDYWAVPFDPAQPLTTPNGLNRQSGKPLRALGEAVKALEAGNMALDARLGDVQFLERDGQRIPVHGGPDSAVYNVLELSFKPGVGYTDPVQSGSSYIQAVTFENGQPVADAILANSQSEDPASPWYADQTRLYSTKTWVRLPFTAGEVARDAIAPPLVLRSPRD